MSEIWFLFHCLSQKTKINKNNNKHYFYRKRRTIQNLILRYIPKGKIQNQEMIETIREIHFKKNKKLNNKTKGLLLFNFHMIM